MYSDSQVFISDKTLENDERFQLILQTLFTKSNPTTLSVNLLVCEIMEANSEVPTTTSIDPNEKEPVQQSPLQAKLKKDSKSR